MNEHPFDRLDDNAFRIAYLIAGYIRNSLNEQEHQELDDWVNFSDQNMQLFEELTDEKNLDSNLEWMDSIRTGEKWEEVKRQAISNRRKKTKLLYFISAAAASVLIVWSIITIINEDIPGQQHGGRPELLENPLTPGRNQATLVLGNGTTIHLDSLNSGWTQKADGLDLKLRSKGELSYESFGNATDLHSIHTLSTPVGGQFKVALPDGSRVWLNAASSIRYASNFNAGERIVELSGEAYFEVEKKNGKSFTVKLRDSAEINVLGTDFNIMSYSDEAISEVVLVKGVIDVSKNGKSNKLSPGMKADISAGKISTSSGADTEEITGWKEGYFIFHNDNIESILRQVSRWYDAKVIYRAEISKHFNASIRRDEPLSKLLHLLELNGYVKFETKKDTIYVLPGRLK